MENYKIFVPFCQLALQKDRKAYTLAGVRESPSPASQPKRGTSALRRSPTHMARFAFDT